MNAIESYLERVCGHLAVPAALREHIRDELRGHLLEAVEGHVAAGMAQEEAAARAIEEFGAPEDVAAGLQGIYGRRLMSVLLEKAMRWKERTMQSGWKWSFVAHAALALTIAAEIFFVAFAATFIFPMVTQGYHEIGLSMPEYWRPIVGVIRLLDEAFVVVLALAIAGIALFEWRYRGENKRTVRLAAGGMLACILMVLVGAAGFASAVPLAQISRFPDHRQLAATMRNRALEADAQYQAFDRACAREDRDDAQLRIGRFLGAVHYLMRSSPALPILITPERLSEQEKLRGLLAEVEEIAESLSRDLPQGKLERLKDDLARLRDAYGRFTSAAEGWPKAEGVTPAIPTDQGK